MAWCETIRGSCCLGAWVRPVGQEPVQAVWAHRLIDLDAGAWDLVTREASWFLSRPYLAVLESRAPFACRFGLLRRGGIPVAAMLVQVIDIVESPLAPEYAEDGAARPEHATGLRHWVNHAGRRAAQYLMQGRLAVCGNLYSSGFHGLALAPGENAAALWPAVAAAFDRAARDAGAGFAMFKDVPAAEARHAAPLSGFGFRRIATEPEMVLEFRPEWGCYAGYLAALRHRYRQAVRKLDRELAEGGLRVAPIVYPEQHDDMLHRLYAEVERRAAVRLAKFKPGYLAALASTAGHDALRCTGIWADERLVAYAMTLKEGRLAHAYCVGMDYRHPLRGPAYARLLNATIENAFELGCSALSLGRTALETKMRLGAAPVPTDIWLRCRNPLVNALVPPIRRLFPPEIPPERHPFRE